MPRVLLVAGLLLYAAGFLLGLVPRVVTGISLATGLMCLSFLLVLAAPVSRLGELGGRVKRSSRARHYAILATLGLLLLLSGIVARVGSDLAAGREWDRVAPDLERQGELAARDLAPHLARLESAPLRLAILARIREIGASHPDVITPVHRRMLTDPDRGVRAEAAETLGRILSPTAARKLVEELPGYDSASAALAEGALAARFGEIDGEGAEAWRERMLVDWFGAEGDERLRLALGARRAWPGDERIRVASEAVLAESLAANPRLLDAFLADPDPELRREAARAGPPPDRVLSRLLVEVEPRVVEALLSSLPPSVAPREILGIAENSRSPMAREAARARLMEGTDEDPSDDSGLLAATFARSHDVEDRRVLLPELLKAARPDNAAGLALRRFFGDPRAPDHLRNRVLDGFAADPGMLPSGDLISRLEGEGETRSFRERVRKVLRERTGEDAGLDPDRWRRVLEDR